MSCLVLNIIWVSSSSLEKLFHSINRKILLQCSSWIFPFIMLFYFSFLLTLWLIPCLYLSYSSTSWVLWEGFYADIKSPEWKKKEIRVFQTFVSLQSSENLHKFPFYPYLPFFWSWFVNILPSVTMFFCREGNYIM